LARVLKNSYDRYELALLVPVPASLSEAGQTALVSACEWIARRGRMAIWLTGRSTAADRLASFKISLPDHLAAGPAAGPPEAFDACAAPLVVYPPIAGRPHHASEAEKRLEAALLKRAWAAGRVWNQTYSPHALVNPVRLDLWWRHECCVVEIDGPDHLDRWKYAQDRRRDVLLQSHGLTVLRFTNSDVLGDVDAVVAAIEKLLQTRRSSPGEMHSHV
jgi:very-short-patch-repair endonuclease